MIKMEVVIPAPSMDFDFDFDCGRSSSYLSIPTTPTAFGNHFYSTPSSPVRMSEFYRDLDESPTSTIPEIKRRTSKSSLMEEPNTEDGDFAFDICQQLETATLSADELFDDGKIRPLETPPRSPISRGRKIFQNAHSSEGKIPTQTNSENTERKKEQVRGRGRNPTLLSSNSRRAVRSLSPDRVSSSPRDVERHSQDNARQLTLISESPSFTTAAASSKSSKRWRLKDFLFRSASEGRGTEKDPLRKYSTLYKKQNELKNASFKSSDSRRGSVPTRELHHTLNRAASEDKKKKTLLPYKGILGGLLFNPIAHAHTNLRSSR